LGDQQPVERVAMMIGQVADGRRMDAGDGQLRKTRVQRGTPDRARLRGEVAAPKRTLDGDLPDVGGAEIDAI
jgi:hypothetical protein